ncbi:P-type conjugative transfer protein TrbG [Sphingomonas koreensis]|jgi:type IV secretion system protein TrbG|uniref:P-type conjugative transfer protein TrbG n=1 Tax=Sphingomonas koreensis TaxID=93064 RepID=A0A1L6JBG5_9SPHN|nr:P-type conjugative transfer protein TrbG [Sphingomonas koreensis]APR53216.1 P-type conjugative transfer protein TrbG [Sphingomonas koreensis]RSU24659.1 P-type conjugative transfer protein TrbG [Sphingomonas koreensis]RSU27072.1 P-type conjugative transfer protein TrbG [Sphingomonas koreensis]RSU30021.1 P-type conjugative transfer protein TrbG [Sphingomonas koreensis]RSU32907.1 P-type conjugative transfer protein TrbG [Sphingomonas koreensis]
MIRPLILSASLFALAGPALAQSREATSPAARVTAANRAALREPLRAGYVNAVQVYPYSEGSLYRLYAAPERVTDIMLQAGEAVVSVAAGDTVRWTVGDTTSGSGEGKRVHILIKPFAAGLSTNLVITTDRRAYHLNLQSTAASAMAALSWTYPQDELVAIQRREAEARTAAPVASGLSVESLNFSYMIGGDKPAWRPIRAFDDGRQTYVEFSANIAVGEAPPLFIIGEDGEAQLVNYRVAGRYYVVDRLFGAAELRLGGKRQQIVRIERVSERRARREAGRGS